MFVQHAFRWIQVNQHSAKYIASENRMERMVLRIRRLGLGYSAGCSEVKEPKRSASETSPSIYTQCLLERYSSTGHSGQAGRA